MILSELCMFVKSPIIVGIVHFITKINVLIIWRGKKCPHNAIGPTAFATFRLFRYLANIHKEKKSKQNFWLAKCPLTCNWSAHTKFLNLWPTEISAHHGIWHQRRQFFRPNYGYLWWGPWLNNGGTSLFGSDFNTYCCIFWKRKYQRLVCTKKYYLLTYLLCYKKNIVLKIPFGCKCS